MDVTGLGSIADFAKSIVDRISPPKASEAEKAQAQIQLQEIIQEREDAVIEAQKSIMVSEMSQGDNFTKRARPTLVYAGLAFIALVHVIFPIASYFSGKGMPALSLPEAFWYSWTGVCGAWIIGRSAEKRGAENKIVSLITGGK